MSYGVKTGFLTAAGLALAIGIGACLNAALLYRGLRRIGAYQPEPGWLWFALRLLLASALMALALWLVMPVAGWWLSASGWVRGGQLCLLVLTGVATYFAALFVMGLRPSMFARRAG